MDLRSRRTPSGKLSWDGRSLADQAFSRRELRTGRSEPRFVTSLDDECLQGAVRRAPPVPACLSRSGLAGRSSPLAPPFEGRAEKISERRSSCPSVQLTFVRVSRNLAFRGGRGPRRRTEVSCKRYDQSTVNSCANVSETFPVRNRQSR